MLAGMIEQDHSIFGGRRAWKQLQTGTLSKADWQAKRNACLYSRGDKTHKGNPNLRIVGDKLLVNDPSKRGLWLEGKLFVPNKWQSDLACYDVRLLCRDGKFTVKVSWTVPDPPICTDARNGVIGVDTNPSGLGMADVSADGNLLAHGFVPCPRVQFASENKRDNDIRLLAKSVVEEAVVKAKPIALEDLKFSASSRSKGSRKFKRMKANFLFKKIVESIESRAKKCGVEVAKVNPAFTSILGNLKYAEPFSLNRHDAAALVIGRRALGFLERQDFTVTLGKSVRTQVTLEGRSCSHHLTSKAYSFLKDRFLKEKPPALTGPLLAPGSKPGIGSSTGETPVGQSWGITGPPSEWVTPF
jgi:IS605 OrfB family transposase